MYGTTQIYFATQKEEEGERERERKRKAIPDKSENEKKLFRKRVGANLNH